MVKNQGTMAEVSSISRAYKYNTIQTTVRAPEAMSNNWSLIETSKMPFVKTMIKKAKKMAIKLENKTSPPELRSLFASEYFEIK